MDCSMPGFPVHYQFPELAQTRPLSRWCHLIISSSSPPAFNLSQHQGLFQGVSSPHQLARVLEFQLQHQSFQWIFRAHFLWDLLVGFPCSPRDSQESSPAPQFKRINSSVLSFLYSRILLQWKGTEKASDVHLRREQRVPHWLVLPRPYILFQLVTNNRKVLPDQLPKHTY